MNDEIKVFGLFGCPLSHSLSPAMHNAALKALGIPGMYFVFERNQKQFLNLVRTKKKMILDGFNVTIPYKELVMPFLDVTDQLAKIAGAVNTVKRVNNRWFGYNTDIVGFQSGLLEARFRARGKKAVILGAGGAARAVLVALANQKIREVYFFDVRSEKSNQVVREFQRRFPKVRMVPLKGLDEVKRELQNADLLVNASGVGLKKNDSSPIPDSFFPRKRILVYDLIYHPKEPVLLKQAKRLGHRVMNGETMLVQQGARAFEIWTEKKAPVLLMRKALRNALCGK
ncbi:MAG: shikimate dehydrogenase [Candidatus Omnitrophica bacterium]|nr:shikimate dehydrogenase [Candidatus Omnitrophota bacterium]